MKSFDKPQQNQSSFINFERYFVRLYMKAIEYASIQFELSGET
jgi:hypothetical protein